METLKILTVNIFITIHFMKHLFEILLYFITFSLQAQSLTFGPTTTLFTLDAAHWELSQPMIPTTSSDGKHVDFYGLTAASDMLYDIYLPSSQIAQDGIIDSLIDPTAGIAPYHVVYRKKNNLTAST